MKLRKKLKNALAAALLGILAGLSPPGGATLVFPDTPLFVGFSPQPNIFFALDDSGSMDWGFLTPEPSGVLFISGFAYFYPHPAPNNLFFWTPPTEEFLTSIGLTVAQTRGVWRARNFNYNSLYYNPTVTYFPWSGKDKNGNTYTNANPTAARFNPYDPGVGTTDLTSTTSYVTAFLPIGFFAFFNPNFLPAFYYTWDNDSNGDGQVGTTEPHTRVKIRPSTPTYTGGPNRTDCASAPVCSYNEEIQNFANWYVYHRKRELVLKRATGDLINSSNAFMGLATLHDNNSVGTAVTDMSVQANKDALLDNLFQVRSSGGTPLRKLLNNVGKYFDGPAAPEDLGFKGAPSPIASQANGGECQQNFTVLMSDGFWNGSSPGVGNEDKDGTGNDTQFDGGPHTDNLSNTLADVAMKYYEKDLSPLPDNIPQIIAADGTVIDDNTAQHLVTYTVAFGLSGSGLTTPANHDAGTPPPPWTDPINNGGVERLDDMQHAAFNGRGLFLNAQNPQTLISSLSAALADVAVRTNFSSTAVAINSTVLKTSSRLFQAEVDTSDNSGELSAFTLNPDGTTNAQVWKASEHIPSAASRNVFTRVVKGPPTNGPLAIPFDSTDSDLVAAVGVPPVGTPAVGGTDIINYIRGDQSKEQQNGGPFRDRTSLLGDITNSSPFSAGADNFFYDVLPGAEGADYPAFIAAKTARFTDVNGDPFSEVYVGSNDGLMHAVDSRDGSETFAYVPSTLLGKLNLLTDPNYNHKFFVDGTPHVSDAFIGGAWKTVLVSALGTGGRTIFGLDVTDPFNFNTSKVMWEFSSSDNDKLGLVLHQPQIARLNNGKWGVIIGNGYNSNGEKAQLIILDVTDGSVIKIIDTKVGGASNSNGLGMPFLLDSDGDRIADAAYAGDLQGNVWKFDLSSSTVSQWKVAFKQGSTPKPLYTAVDAAGNPQPITSRPVVSNHPDGGFMVLFGTGKYMEAGDNQVPANPKVQTFYGVRDNGSALGSGRSSLVEQDVLANVPVIDSGGNVITTVRVTTNNPVDFAAKNGWFIDLETPGVPNPIADGEMVIANPLVRFGRVIFVTFIPGATPCDQGGQSVLMELDALGGARLENSVFDDNNDGVIDAADFVSYNSTQVPGSGIYIPATLASPAVISAQDASVEYKQTSGINTSVTTTLESTGGTTVGRQSWRQLR